MQTNQVKVTFKNETKKFKRPSDFEGLLQQTIKAFGNKLPASFKFFYVDADHDLISISCQEDLEEALESMPQLRLVVEEGADAARSNFEPDQSSSSINFGFSPAISNNLYQDQNRRVSQAFEEISYEEEKLNLNNNVTTQSIGVGSA